MESTVRHSRRPTPRIREALETPRSTPVVQRNAQSPWNGLGEAWSYLSTLVSGVVVWGGVGFGLDAWLNTRPVAFVVGALVGNFAGIYLIYLRAFGTRRTPSDDASEEVACDAA